jgi:predicted nucleic acid-binding Zn finger protein
MSRSCGSKRYIFQEAIDHCRWKKVLRNNVLVKTEFQEHNLHQFTGKCFNEILLFVYNICDKVKGIGMLTIYDITSAICRYNKIIIEKIYIIGKGPKRAIRLLDIKAKSQKIENITLNYVEIPEILKAFQEKNYEINLQIKNSNNGDDFESYICNWQKDK